MADHRYAVSLGGTQAQERTRVGGKAASLHEMMAGGHRVPPAFAVTADACRAFLAQDGVADALRAELAGAADAEARRAASERIGGLVAELPVPGPVADAIRAGYRELGEVVGEDAPAVAVRSSAVAEDTSAASFAGEYETYLWISGAEAVVDAVRRCWASLFNEGALEYQLHHGVDPAENPMGVAIQLMVDARCAGVMFTLNPVSGDPSRVCIEASWGLGLAVVNGEVSPDRFLVDKAKMEIAESHVGEKALRYGPPSDGTLEVSRGEVPADDRARPCLSDDEVLELARLGHELHAAAGCAQDIEWAIDARLEAPDNLFLLQRRPETVHSQRKKAVGMAGADVTQWIAATITKGREIDL